MSRKGGDRSMAVIALSLVTRDGKPIYLRTFEADNALKFHFIMHAALDHFEEKQQHEKSR
mgnify:CR=1 FL=1